MKQIAINPNDPGDLNDKLKECMVMKRVRHPYIVRFKYHFINNSLLCLLFDNCDKGDLDAFLKNQKGLGNYLSESRIKKFIIELLLALEYMHSQNIIHRDIKPSNIFLKGKDYTI
jgi:NIMA (never in mitosis gene a)-related kinase 1/4/5